MTGADDARAPDRSGVRAILTARALRGFADGFVSILLARYLTALGFSPFQIGAVVTGTLIGSAALTLAVGLAAYRFPLRSVLLAAAALMLATGVGFASATAFWLVLAVAVIGTLNPSSGDVSVFLPTEQAYLANHVDAPARPRLYGLYNVAGAVAAAIGALASALPEPLSRGLHWRLQTVQRGGFVLYAALALAAAFVYRRLPRDRTDAKVDGRQHRPLAQSRRTVLELAALFSLDSAGGGLVIQSLLVLWLHLRFNLSPGTMGVVFFAANVLGGASQLLAGPISARIGLIKTTAFTHLPANAMLALAAFAPRADIAVALLLARALCSSMDIPARQSFVMAVVPPEERAAAASVTNVPRALATATTPILAGALLAASHAGWPLLIAGVTKMTYDLTLLALFHDVPEQVGAHRTRRP
ncbi:MAG: MFS transporter [Acidimicrobiales bacterium]